MGKCYPRILLVYRRFSDPAYSLGWRCLIALFLDPGERPGKPPVSDGRLADRTDATGQVPEWPGKRTERTMGEMTVVER
jgi:hypothetical protein